MYGELRFTLEKGRSIPAPQYRTSGRLTPRVDDGGWYGTTGVGPDLYVAAQDAVRAMIDHLAAEYDLSPRGRVRAREPVRRPEDLGDRGRGRVRRQRAASAGRVSRLIGSRLWMIRQPDGARWLPLEGDH